MTNHFSFYRRVVPAAGFLPACGATDRKLLHFEASDWNTTVWINGELAGGNVGGYNPFSFDVSAAAAGGVAGDVEIVVGVFDQTELNGMHQSAGKQAWKSFDNPGGMMFTGVSGLWAPVWAECVPQSYIEDVELVADIRSGTLAVTVEVPNAPAGATVDVTATAFGATVASASGVQPNAPTTLTLAAPVRLWSADSPFLYNLTVTLSAGSAGSAEAGAGAGAVVDTVGSYFGMRTLSTGTVHVAPATAEPNANAGAAPAPTPFKAVLYNGKFEYQVGVLDQGWFPDGLYSSPTEEAMLYDLQWIKRLGFNTVRKHMKVEPRRWYYHCDRIGLHVWQDVPALYNGGGGGTPETDYNGFLHKEIANNYKARRNSPAVAQWQLMNEGWGQGDQPNTQLAMDALQGAGERTRPISDASGGRGLNCNYTIVPQTMTCPSPTCTSFWTGGCLGNITGHHHVRGAAGKGADSGRLCCATVGGKC